MSALPRVGLITPCRNRREKTMRFLDCVRGQQYPEFQVYLVDSNSTDGTPDLVRRLYPEVMLLRADDSKYWTGATNIGVRRALDNGCEYVVTINDDSVVGPEWLSTLVAEATRGNYSILASRLEFLNQPGLLWALGASNNWADGRLFLLPDTSMWADECPTLARGHKTFEVETLCGNGVLFHRRVFESTGLYDEAWTPHYHADSEFVLRARRRGFVPHITTLTVVRNDVFNDGPGGRPMRTPPDVKQGDWRSLVRRSVHDGRILFFSIRSDLYWRALAAYIWRHCPRSLLTQCVRRLIGRLWTLHFAPHWNTFRPASSFARPTPKSVPALPPAAFRALAVRGEFTMDTLDDVERTESTTFLEMAYLRFFGRPIDDGAHGFRAIAATSGGRYRVIHAMLQSKEAALLQLNRRGTALAKRMLAWHMTHSGKSTSTTEHVVEDLERIGSMPPESLVMSAYKSFLCREPEQAIWNMQVKTAKESPLKLVAAVVASAEYGMNWRRKLSPLAARCALMLLRSGASRECGDLVSDVPPKSLADAAGE